MSDVGWGEGGDGVTGVESCSKLDFELTSAVFYVSLEPGRKGEHSRCVYFSF